MDFEVNETSCPFGATRFPRGKKKRNKIAKSTKKKKKENKPLMSLELAISTK